MDKVVAAAHHKYCVLVFTEFGKIYRVEINELDNRLQIQLLAELPLK